uniref:Tenascin-X-like protein 2 n=1 Tax=Halisarca dujardinii TaxID=2583056 RepID=A0AA96S2F5_HALDU|nr:tenascin-X-like protein 2 [Halisarca dujardinii]
MTKDEGELIEANIKATSVTLYHLLGKDVDYRCNVLTETSTDQFNITGGVRNTLSGLSADTTHTVNCVAYRGGVEYCLEATTTFRTSPVATVTDATSTSVDYYLEFGLSYNCTLLGKDNKVTATHKNVDLEKRQTFHGLTPGQNYSIRCSNRYRVFSVNTTFTTLEAPASEPMNLEGTAASSSQIRLTWQQPDYPNGVITSYVITYNEVQVDTNTASLGYTMTGLQPFTTYNISVASRNGAGVGEESREIGVKTRPGVPGAPTIARNISTTCQSLQISWTPPANTGGDEIMYYTVTYYVSGAVKNYINHTVYDIVVNAALVTLDELTPNTEYTVLVRASNSEQTGEAANTSVRTDSRDSISQRIIPFSSTGIIVAITPPPLQNIIGKAYTYSLSFVPNHLRVSPYNTSTTFQIFNGLQANTEYKVTSLVYRNGKGLCYEGMATGTTLPDTPPSRVRNLIVTRVTSTTIELRWERPEMTNGPITSYLIYYNGVQEDTSNVSLEYNLTGLQPFTTYNIGVAAKNGAGVGEESPAEITATTLEGVPGKVLKLRTVGVAVRGEPYITQPIAWERPPGHMSILEYVITISNTKTSQIAEALTNQTSFNLSLPTPRDCIDYNVSVAARSAVGQGEAASITVKYGGDGVTYNCSLALSQSHPAAASTYHTSSENGLFISSLRANTEYIVICTVSKGEQELCYEGTATGRTP